MNQWVQVRGLGAEGTPNAEAKSDVRTAQATASKQHAMVCMC